jgi:hypothetical protein
MPNTKQAQIEDFIEGIKRTDRETYSEKSGGQEITCL